MDWLLVQLSVGRDWSEIVCAALEDMGAIAVTTKSADDEACYEEGPQSQPPWRDLCITGLFPAVRAPEPIIEGVKQALCWEQPPAYRIDQLEDREWENVTAESFRPRRVGHRLWVCPSWCDPPRPRDVNIILDPGLAFGTGTHASTALCLDWLSRHELGGLEVIDYGCGSGILAIAALKLGAARVWGVDIDPRALSVSEGNANRNGVGTEYSALCPKDLSQSQRADVVMANILANTLTRLAPRLSRLVKTGGRLLLSGLLKDQGKLVSSHYQASFSFEQNCREDWLLMIGTKRW